MLKKICSKLSFKLDVSLSNLALVFVCSVACYNIYQCVSSLVSSADDENMNAVSDVENPLLLNMNKNLNEEKPMISIEKNETEAVEDYKPETQTAKKAPKVNVDNVLEGDLKPTDKAQNTVTEAVKPADDCFENVERNFSGSGSKQKSPLIESDILIKKTDD